MDLIVRAARESDWAALRALRLQALAEAPLAFGSTLAREQDLAESVWRDRASHPGQVLAWSGDHLIGTAIGVHEGEDVHLMGMYVAPDHRGTGTADRLIEGVVGKAMLAGADRVVLWVTDVNPGAERCYTRHGFRRTGRTEPLRHTPAVTEHEMELPLA